MTAHDRRRALYCIFSRFFDILNTEMKYAVLMMAVVAALTAGRTEHGIAHAECREELCVGRSTEVKRAEEPRASVDIIAGSKTITYTDGYITPSDFTVAAEIEARKINAPLGEKLELVDKYLQNGADYKTALGVCFPLLPRAVEKAANELNVPAVDAKVVYSGGKFSVAPEKAGRVLDEERLYGGIYYCFRFGGDSVKAATVAAKPRVTADELKKNLVLRGEYTTDYRTSTAARAHNVALAASKLDGACVKAGESLSFNEAVGPRTEKNGFKTAKIIIDGSYVDGIGGGACQASTAVYNAALVSGLYATAYAHSICPHYCPPGLDAMISSASDLVIKNTTEHDVFFSVSSGGGCTTVRIYGEPSEFTIVPESVVVSETAPEEIEKVDVDYRYFDRNTAQSGDRMLVAPGKTGYESATYLNYFKGGELIKRKKIRENKYKSSPLVFMIAP